MRLEYGRMKRNGPRKSSFARKFGVVLLLLAAAGTAAGIWRPWGKTQGPNVPAEEVKLGDFVDYVELRGEIRVRTSTVITAPYNAGDLQILKLCKDGAPIKKGEVVVEFDRTSLQRSADQFRSTLKQVEAEIQRANAQQRLREEQITTDVVSAQYGLERARLDASTRDVIPPIENEKNVLALAKAEQKVKEVESRITSSRVGAEADLAATFRRRDKARADLEQAERNLAALALTSPVDGIITLLPNSRARTSILGGGAVPVFKDGDRAWAGAGIAEVPDLGTIQANAPVYEADRGKVAIGQQVSLRVDGVPDKEQKGVVKEISPLAKLDYSSYPIRKSFDLAVQLDKPDPRLRAGMSATFRVEVERLPNSIVIPATAAFERGVRIVAYVLTNGKFEERTLEIGRRGDGKILVARGLKPGERIALKDPTLMEEQK